jgi:hypothetical protein
MELTTTPQNTTDTGPGVGIRGVGRPKGSLKRGRKDAILQVLMTEKQLGQLRVRAMNVGLTLSEYVRQQFFPSRWHKKAKSKAPDMEAEERPTVRKGKGFDLYGEE